ncbi:MAG: lysophospholipid acyltransferase family protein [Anaerolineales bacterium]|jgi:1-acyl-sn-glycerol-3-phosphate acyltransferase
MVRQFIVFLLNVFFRITTSRKITGLENIPVSEPTIIVGNHIGILDGIMIPTIPGIADHPNLIVVIAEKYEKVPVFKWAIDHLNFMFIDRFNPDVKTIKKVLQQLKLNGLLIISPEGTRSPNASLIEGKSGPAYLAAKTGSNIVPIGVTGSEDQEMRSRFRNLKRLKVTIEVGHPFKIPSLPRNNREEFLNKYTDEIMCQIALLLPASYRGIYSNHPRLIELLEKSSQN